MMKARRVNGTATVKLLECVSPAKGKWRVRWDVQENEDGSATYMEAEFDHSPTPEDMEQALYEADVELTQEDLAGLAVLLGISEKEFLRRMKAKADARIASDPYLQILEVVREQHLTATDITDAAALRVPATFFSFAELCRRGRQVENGMVLRYNGKIWRVVQTHTPMDIYPPSIATASLYARIEPEHIGTLNDPIPYEQGMALESGKYYEQYGVLYLCILTTAVGYPNDLKDLPTLVSRV